MSYEHRLVVRDCQWRLKIKPKLYFCNPETRETRHQYHKHSVMHCFTFSSGRTDFNNDTNETNFYVP